MIDARDGPQTGAWQWALVNNTPLAVGRSKFGVLPVRSVDAANKIVQVINRDREYISLSGLLVSFNEHNIIASKKQDY